MGYRWLGAWCFCSWREGGECDHLRVRCGLVSWNFYTLCAGWVESCLERDNDRLRKDIRLQDSNTVFAPIALKRIGKCIPQAIEIVVQIRARYLNK